MAVSVVLPYRDAAAHVEEAVASVLAEPACGELLAVDDGSSDGGPARVAAWAARDRRVVPLATGGAGLVAALELGRRAARFDLVGRMDADDLSLPGRLARAARLLDDDPRLGAAGVRVDCFPDDAVGDGLRRYVAWQNALLSPADHARDLLVEAPLCHPSVVLRKEALDAVGGWRATPWPEDWDLWLRLDAAGWGLAKAPELLFRWRQRPGRRTFTAAECAPARLIEARAAFLAPRLIADGRPLVVWGAGKTGKRLARALEAHGVRATRFVDIDPKKRRAREVEVIPPEALRRGADRLVVAVGQPGARDIVRARLLRAGFVEGPDFVCAA